MENDVSDKNIHYEKYYSNVVYNLDEKLIEFESEIILHSILEEGRMNEFKEFCKKNKDLSWWESINKFKKNG